MNRWIVCGNGSCWKILRLRLNPAFLSRVSSRLLLDENILYILQGYDMI
jgi:hypothetical protein